MKKRIAIASIAFLLVMSPGAFAMDSQAGHDTGSSNTAQSSENFKHTATVEGIRVEFEVMPLSGMKEPSGATHHLMLKAFDDKMNHPISDIKGKIKIVSPSGAEQVAPIINYSGVFASNFTLTEKGKYGVICLFVNKGKKYLTKFWYPHS